MLTLRTATRADLPALARMNKHLIEDQVGFQLYCATMKLKNQEMI